MHIAYIVNVTSICVYRDNDGAIFHTIYEICYSEHGDTTSPLRLACSMKFKSMTVRCNLVKRTQSSICYSEHGDTTSPPRLAYSVKFQSMTVRCNLAKSTQGSGSIGVADALERISAPIGTNTYTYVQST